jgi:TnpA family transposase
MVKALDRISEISALSVGGLDLSPIPARRVAELARYGLAGKAPALTRHPAQRRVATILAALHHLAGRAVDDALELLDVLMVSDLLARAERASNEEKLRRYPWVSKDAGKLAAAVQVLFAATEVGEDITVDQLWASIEAVVPRAELRAAMNKIADVAPPPGSDPDGEWRTQLAGRIATVRGFLPMLCEVIEFGATAEGERALAAMRGLPEVLAYRSRKLGGGQIPAALIDAHLVGGEWRRLVYRPGLPDGVVDKACWVFCVLERFHKALRRRDVYATTSTRWRDPRDQLLDGPAWTLAKPAALNALGLPEDPDPLLAAHARLLDASYREVGGRLVVNTAVSVGADGRLHVQHLEAVPDPPSLVDLRKRLAAMLPRVDLSEVVLEVMAWQPRFVEAFTAVSGGGTRLDDVHVTLAAVLTAHALNIGYAPVVAPSLPALTRDRLSHVDQNYLRAETIAAANVPLIEAQTQIDLAQSWGGGLVSAIDGMRFVVPIPTIHARPNSKYFGRRRGAQWLNMVNDQAVGLGGVVVAGTPRDSLHTIDVIYSQDGGQRPEVIVTDTASYTDVVFGLLHLLGFSYRPQLADLPDQKLWRVDPAADYGPLDAAARGKVDLGAIRRHWPDILRVVASVHTGTVTAHDALRVLSRDGHPTPLGAAVAAYGRIFKSLHVLTYVDDEPYRRDIKAMRNLQETRHDLGRHVFHGQKGELRQRYHTGMEDQLGSLGLVLNCITLWNTVYLNAALESLRARGYPVLDDDVARLSPFMRRHINVHGHYSFLLPELPGGRRLLRDPDTADDEV